MHNVCKPSSARLDSHNFNMYIYKQIFLIIFEIEYNENIYVPKYTSLF